VTLTWSENWKIWKSLEVPGDGKEEVPPSTSLARAHHIMAQWVGVVAAQCTTAWYRVRLSV
jgi:hypothetical protein